MGSRSKGNGNRGEFKQSNGFQKFDLPRYYVPLTIKGRLFVALKLYRGINALPPFAVRLLKDARRVLAQRRTRPAIAGSV